MIVDQTGYNLQLDASTGRPTSRHSIIDESVDFTCDLKRFKSNATTV